MIRYLILSILSACGTAPAEQQGTQGTQAGPDRSVKGDGIDHGEPEPEQKTVVVEYRKRNNEYSLAVVNSSDLPECDKARSGQRAYVKSQDAFYLCLDDVWQPDDDPERTPTPAVEPAKPAAANEWTDPQTALRWLVGAEITQAVLDASRPCQHPWREPKREELTAAMQHGLGLASVSLKGSAALWSAEFQRQDDGSYLRWHIASDGVEKAAPGAIAGIACVEGT